MAVELLHRTADDLQIRSEGDGMTVVYGLVLPYGIEAEVQDPGAFRSYRERMLPGCAARTIRERGSKVKMLVSHDRANPVGRFVVLRETPGGLYGEAVVADTARGRETVELIRAGILDSWSVGFKPVRQRDVGGVVERSEINIRECSACAFPSYETAAIGGVRSEPDPSIDRERRALYIANLLP